MCIGWKVPKETPAPAGCMFIKNKLQFYDLLRVKCFHWLDLYYFKAVVYKCVAFNV